MLYNSLVPLKRSSVGSLGPSVNCNTTCQSQECCEVATEACAASKCPKNCTVDSGGDCAYSPPGSYEGCWKKDSESVCSQIGTGSCSALDCNGECQNSRGCFDGEGAETNCQNGAPPNACGGKYKKPDIPTMKKIFYNKIMSQSKNKVTQSQADCVFKNLFANMSEDDVYNALKATNPPPNLNQTMNNCGINQSSPPAPPGPKPRPPAPPGPKPRPPAPPGPSNNPNNKFFSTTMGKILIIFMSLLVAMGLVVLVHHLTVMKN